MAVTLPDRNCWWRSIAVPVGSWFRMGGSNVAFSSGLDIYWTRLFFFAEKQCNGHFLNNVCFNDVNVNYLVWPNARMGPCWFSISIWFRRHSINNKMKTINGSSGATFCLHLWQWLLPIPAKKTMPFRLVFTGKLVNERARQRQRIAFDVGIQYHELGGLMPSTGLVVKNIEPTAVWRFGVPDPAIRNRCSNRLWKSQPHQLPQTLSMLAIAVILCVCVCEQKQHRF